MDLDSDENQRTNQKAQKSFTPWVIILPSGCDVAKVQNCTSPPKTQSKSLVTRSCTSRHEKAWGFKKKVVMGTKAPMPRTWRHCKLCHNGNLRLQVEVHYKDKSYGRRRQKYDTQIARVKTDWYVYM